MEVTRIVVELQYGVFNFKTLEQFKRAINKLKATNITFYSNDAIKCQVKNLNDSPTFFTRHPSSDNDVKALLQVYNRRFTRNE